MYLAYTLHVAPHYDLARFRDSNSNDLGLLIEAADQLPFSLQKYLPCAFISHANIIGIHCVYHPKAPIGFIMYAYVCVVFILFPLETISSMLN